MNSPQMTTALAGIPRVRAVEPEGSVSAEGFYFRHVNRQPCPGDDRTITLDLTKTDVQGIKREVTQALKKQREEA